MGLDVWAGGGGGVVYLAPRSGKDFMLVLFKAVSDAGRAARLESANTNVGTVTRGPVLLIYLTSSSRIGRLRAALAAIRS
jgi:hypothetical protein